MSQSTIKADDLTLEQVSALRGVSANTIRRMVGRNECPAGTRIGNTLRFDRKKILDWLTKPVGGKVDRAGQPVTVRAGIDAEVR
jgi:excisionase family DNA binding protein